MAQRTITTEVRSFLESMKVPCVISTLRPDGHPITSATWYGFIGDDVVVSTPALRNKARNVRHDGRISFIVDTKERPYRGVAIEGVAELIDDSDGAILDSIVRRYLGPDAAPAVQARLASGGERVILRIHAQRVRPWAIKSAGAMTESAGSMTKSAGAMTESETKSPEAATEATAESATIGSPVR